MRPSVHEVAKGRWPGILHALGVDQSYLACQRKEGPCPFCGGTTRFRFDDKDGNGTFFCSHCKPGKGVEFVMRFFGLSFREAAERVEAVVGNVPISAPSNKLDDSGKLAICRSIWSESQVVTGGDPVSLYLAGRGWSGEASAVIRFHPRLVFRHDDGRITRHPAMVTRVQDECGAGCAIHRTYLSGDGQKAAVPTVKKVAGNLPAGAAIRLFHSSECMGVAEGIETALCAFLLFGVPTWAAVTAGGLERWTPPDEAKRIVIFGDNDASGVGQAAAWNLNKRLKAAGIDTDVRIPSRLGDWNDVHREDQGQ